MTYDSHQDITNFVEISSWLATGGQPTPAQIADLGGAGYQVVLNLATPDSDEALPNEDWLVSGQDMTYIHLPIPWRAPTQEHRERFFALMDACRGDKVFVHCILNMRVSLLIFLYRVCRLGVPIPEAEKDLSKIWRPSGPWRQLMRHTLREEGFAV